MNLLDVLKAGERRVTGLGESDELRAAAISFLHAYEAFAGASVAAASPQAERVLGAAMILDPSLRAVSSDHVVLFDVNVASGTLLARESRRLRLAGASSVMGVVLHALVEPPNARDCDLDELHVLDVAPSSHEPRGVPLRPDLS